MALAPDTRAMSLDLFDAFCRRQEARIRQELSIYTTGREIRERDARHAGQPDLCETRGHAVGPRRPTLSELDGDQD